MFKGVVIAFDNNKNTGGKTIVTTKKDIQNKALYIVEAILILMFLLSFPLFLNLSKEFPQLIMIWVVLFIMLSLMIVVPYLIEKRREQLEKLTLEKSDFTKRFNVKSTNQIEGRYLITPAFMERFQNLQTAFGAKNIKCAFYSDQIIIAIQTRKNLFEIGSLYKSLFNPRSIDNFYNELSSILNMVEYFKFDEKIGL